MATMNIIPKHEFDRIRGLPIDRYKKLAICADMNRANTLMAVKKAGSGHLGSSFSAIDLVTWLYMEVMNVTIVGIESKDRDIFFSSKGHDVPAQYAVLYALGFIKETKLLRLRRLNGLDGHPERHIDGLEASTGSLGMGISKAKGMAWAKRFQKHKGKVFVMTGDGELQEGQIWESLQTAVHQQIDITVIVDHNKIQTDMPVDEIISLQNIETKFDTFGCHVERCDGHDFQAIGQRFRIFDTIKNKPKILIADTIKGRGVSFMETLSDLPSAEGKYLWHSGAPDDADFQAGYSEIYKRICLQCEDLGIAIPQLQEIPKKDNNLVSKVTKEYVAQAYGDELLKLVESNPKIIVLDGDLAADCKIRSFSDKYPERFIENGIAEQDMVSMAGGLASMGLLPVVNTFSSFLTSRANEQIYNNACEKTKIIYVAHYAGMIPAGPGKSHQSVRDISLFGAIPNMQIIQPANSQEAMSAIRYCVEDAQENCMLRLNIGPSPREIMFPADYKFEHGKGVVVKSGDDAILFAYGAVMLHEALLASELADSAEFGIEVVNMPWLNRINQNWLEEMITKHDSIYVLEDHARVGGLADRLLDQMIEFNLLIDKSFYRLAIQDYPACGTPLEVLGRHGLDGHSIALKILKDHKVECSIIEDKGRYVFNTMESAQ